MNRWWCPHPLTTEPDEDGKGICLRCGALLQLRLTAEVLRRAMNQMLEAGR